MTDKRPMPDNSSCRHCGHPIVWNDYSYIHVASGFDDCGVTLVGGERTTLGAVAERMGLQPTGKDPSVDDVRVVVDPEVVHDGSKTRAEPVEWGAP